MTPQKAAIYARVSTNRQDADMQVSGCKEWLKEKGYTLFGVYQDIGISGRISSRPEYDRMLKDALHRKFDVVIVWKMDRLTRRGISETFEALKILKQYNVSVISITEPFLSTDSPAADLILAVLSWVAQQESLRISERVTTGIRHRKDEYFNGWKGITKDTEQSVRELRGSGLTMREIASKVGVSVGFVHKILKNYAPEVKKINSITPISQDLI